MTDNSRIAEIGFMPSTVSQTPQAETDNEASIIAMQRQTNIGQDEIMRLEACRKVIFGSAGYCDVGSYQKTVDFFGKMYMTNRYDLQKRKFIYELAETVAAKKKAAFQ